MPLSPGLVRVVVVAAVLAAAPAATAARDVPAVGDLVRVKVRGDGATGFVARELERQDGDRSDDHEIRGRVERFDRETGTLRILGIRVRVPEDVRVRGDDGATRSPDEIVPGVRVQVDVGVDGPERVVRKIKIREDQGYDERRLVGRIEDVRWRAGRPSSVVVLGFEVEVSRSTEFEGYPGLLTPSLIAGGASGRDDDDLRIGAPGAAARFVFAGELRARVEAFDDEDGDAEIEDREVEGKVSAILGAAALFGPVSAFVKVDAEREYLLASGTPFDEGDRDVRVSEAFVEAPGLGSPHLTWVVGRQKFDEDREWWYRTSDLDAVRLLGRWRRFSGELSWSRTLFDERRTPDDARKRNRIVVLRWEPDADVVVEGRWIDRRDVDGGGDAPSWYGLRIAGEIARRLEWRVDGAIQRGERERRDANTGAVSVRPIDAKAFDARVTWRPRVFLDPTFTIGHAAGSGDRTAGLDIADQPSGVDRSFRQTGLHRNRGKDNGTVSFRFYGEVLDPELTNLRVSTVAVGLRPRRSVSIDLIHHRYRQDVASDRLREVDIDSDPTGNDPDLGEAWDLAIGYEPGRWLEIRFTAGVFRPGAAFDRDVDGSVSVRLQTKFRF